MFKYTDRNVENKENSGYIHPYFVDVEERLEQLRKLSY